MNKQTCQINTEPRSITPKVQAQIDLLQEMAAIYEYLIKFD